MSIFNSVIAAVSTPPGKGGVALIRVSGEGAITVSERVLFPKSKKKLSEIESKIATRVDIYLKDKPIDDGMATIFRAPASYTGEDTVEITCHGGMLVTKLVLESLFSAGAVPASRGEFTRRAYINGKISLTDAEAIGTLLEAKSYGQVRISALDARDKLTDRISKIRETLISLMSSIYARIDYPDEDLGELSVSEISASLVKIREDMQSLSRTYRTGKAINEGIKTVICGKPNTGKSTLYNLILGEDAAIVTDIEGTTRDVLSDTVTLGRVLIMLSDTAGVRDFSDIDTVERIGITRSLERIEKAELIIAVFDGSREASDEDTRLIEKIKCSSAERIALINKSDKDPLFDRSSLGDVFPTVIEISAQHDGEATREKLSDAINALMTDEKVSVGEDAIISSARQSASLERAIEHVSLAIEAICYGMPEDAVSSDLELAIGAISELDGKAVTDEVVTNIFKNFCVGK